jgi:hypothetical protein
MLVTFREHAAPDLCIFHTRVTMRAEGGGTGEFAFGFTISALFASQYKQGTDATYLKC